MIVPQSPPRVVLAEPPGEVRSAFLATLKEVGIEVVELISKLEQLVEELSSGNLDLLVLNYAFGDGKGYRLVKELRLDKMGTKANPFLPVVMTSWDNGGGPVKAALSTGIDDLLIFPLPMGTLKKRVGVLAQKRRPFVVTSDYIGPERRSDPNRKSEVPLFDPPNTLGRKLAGEAVSDEEIEIEVQRMREEVSAEKLRRDAFQITFLSRLIVEDHKAGAGTDVLLDRLSKVSKMSQGLLDRATETQAATLRPMIQTLVGTIDDCDLDIESQTFKRTLRLLEPVSQGITLAVREHGDAGALADEVQQTIETYRARRAAAAAASAEAPA
jgi:DNA-binding response OmpR family regulator